MDTSERFSAWLGEIDKALESGNLDGADRLATYATQGATVLGLPNEVFLFEFLDFLLDNMSDASRHSDRKSPLRDEAIQVAKQAVDVVRGAFGADAKSLESLLPHLRDVRFKATLLQLRSHGMRGTHGPPRLSFEQMMNMEGDDA